MGVIVYLDTILVPFSIFLTVGYHAYLWHSLKKKPAVTSIGINALRRRSWFLDMNDHCLQGDDKKGMLAVQSLRNTLMATVLTATVAILITLLVAAVTNNSYNASHLLSSAFFGSQSGRIFALKYGSASLFLLVSFLCSSMGVGFLIDANFLINACAGEYVSGGHTQTVMERGFMLALVGNRVLCISFPLLLWMFGPVAVALSSLALVWVLYQLDFVADLTKMNKSTRL